MSWKLLEKVVDAALVLGKRRRRGSHPQPVDSDTVEREYEAFVRKRKSRL